MCVCYRFHLLVKPAKKEKPKVYRTLCFWNSFSLQNWQFTLVTNGHFWIKCWSSWFSSLILVTQRRSASILLFILRLLLLFVPILPEKYALYHRYLPLIFIHISWSRFLNLFITSILKSLVPFIHESHHFCSKLHSFYQAFEKPSSIFNHISRLV